MRSLLRRLPAPWRSNLRYLLRAPTATAGFLTGERWPSTSSVTATTPAASANPLETYFDANRSGPGIWKWRHYFDIYHRHFARFIGREIVMVEIGIYSGGSLGMWRQYFGSQCHVHGVDIEPACESYATDGVTVWIGDQSDPAFWARFVKQVPAIDIVIDDGGHLAHQQIPTLEALLPRLRPGGVYLCEDIQGEHNPFSDYVAGLSHQLNANRVSEFHPRSDQPLVLGSSPLQRDIHGIHVYPFVVVIERRDQPVTELRSVKRGTQWQPFL